MFGDVQNPSSLHAFGYANGNSLLYTDPEGTQGVPSYMRAPKSYGLPTALDQCSKDYTWIGCACAVGAKLVDDDYETYDQFIAEGKCTPEFVKGFKACDTRPAEDAWYSSDIGKNTRDFWMKTPLRRRAMACTLGTGAGLMPLPMDVSRLPREMQQDAAMMQFSVGLATAGVAAPGAVRTVVSKLDDFGRAFAEAYEGERLAKAGMTTEGRIASTADSVPNAMAMTADDAGRVGGVAAKPAVPPRVQSRINIQTGSVEQGVGWKHVLDRHFGSKNASRFTIPEEELRKLLQSKEVVATPISRVLASADGPRYVREVTLSGRAPIGLDKFTGWKPTSTMTVLTDSAGNLVTATPGVIK